MMLYPKKTSSKVYNDSNFNFILFLCSFVDVPDDSTDFLEFIHIVRHYREGTNTPTVLHCR